MAGFSSVTQAGGPVGAAPAQAAAPAPQEPEDPNADYATEEEEALGEAWLDRLADVLYPEGGLNPTVEANLMGDFDDGQAQMFAAVEPPVDFTNPIDALAATAALLTVTIDGAMGYQEKANEAGRSGSPDGPNYGAILMHVGEQTVELLGEAVEALGIAELSEDDLGGAMLRAIDLYRYIAPIDQQVMQQELADMELGAREGRIPAFNAFAGAAPAQQGA